ncbi:MAG: hypothetical protein IJ106_09265 [Parasporobacterium sp.]|nr:hypothetical protein [Parasporobacterium sp.]
MSRRASRNRKKRRQRNRRGGRKPFIILIVILILIAALTVGIILFEKYRTFSWYSTDSTISISNSEENTEYYQYGNGYLKCAGDGIIYFDRNRIIWSEYYSMLQPITDICEEYIAAADIGQRNIYLYDKSGFVNRINLSHNITDVEVSRTGMVAVASNEGNINYLEILDRNGNEIMTEKSVFSSRGYLMDLTLSDDGTRLAAVFVSIDKGTLRSKVVFYDLSGESGSDDIIVGVFDQYESIMMTTIRFLADDTVCAIGDLGISIYQFKDVPELVYEDLELPWEIQSLFFDEQYIGMIVEAPDSDTRYQIRVLDLTGNIQLEQGTDFSYGRAAFAGENVLLSSYNECLMYSFAGVEKVYLSFDQHIEALISGDGRHFVYGTNSNTQFLTIR